MLMKAYFTNYIQQLQATLGSVPTEQLEHILEKFKDAAAKEQQVFTFGNGGSAMSASHFVTDLGKGSSDKMTKRFRCISLNDNVGWLTALGNDYSYDDIFVRQLMNLARPGDLAFTMSVSGNSPNLVKAVEWAKQNGVYTIALLGGQRGALTNLVDYPVVIDSKHYARVEDVHMSICHMISFAFIEHPLG
ncbi:SIS domain-containing protein [Chryseolinea sp. Jin1]|uniref:SIS domain-containing protein n=2 Tax=Chryseolinea lacunae TaxID=2801331 RepID=A0ABS1KWV2_9BACT|nr:SIS domain-containing protein [Chryseolinea lacunae]